MNFDQGLRLAAVLALLALAIFTWLRSRSDTALDARGNAFALRYGLLIEASLVPLTRSLLRREQRIAAGTLVGFAAAFAVVPIPLDLSFLALGGGGMLIAAAAAVLYQSPVLVVDGGPLLVLTWVIAVPAYLISTLSYFAGPRWFRRRLWPTLGSREVLLPGRAV